MKDLKKQAIQGGIARGFAQIVAFVIRLVSLMVLARLLGPKDFGVVGMVTAFTGVLELFRDFGLSAATVQRTNVTDEQTSTLFWINTLVGVVLAFVIVAIAPLIAAFYHEPRLQWVTIVLAAGMLFNAVGVQHSAKLQREMRFTALAVISVISLFLGSVIAIVGTKAGFGYWSLVAMTISVPLMNTICLWWAARWIPGLPRRGTGIKSMLHFGGTVTLTSLIVYLANNLEKILVGRYWGVDAIGLYGRAYQLINIPTSNLNTIAGEVAFSALSRLQHDKAQRKSYFLKGFSLVIGFTVPITIACAVFSNDVVQVILGAKWKDAAPLFQWLAPTILVFAMANPLSWLLTASGLVSRLMKMSLVIAPIKILGYIIGLPYGPRGVACAYSVVMVLWILPLIAWAVHDTEISFKEVMKTVIPPLGASVLSGGIALGVELMFCKAWPPLARLIFENAILFATFVGVLMCGGSQRALYVSFFREMMTSRSTEKEVKVSA